MVHTLSIPSPFQVHPLDPKPLPSSYLLNLFNHSTTGQALFKNLDNKNPTIKNQLESLPYVGADILWDLSLQASPVGPLFLTAWGWLLLPWPGLLYSAVKPCSSQLSALLLPTSLLPHPQLRHSSVSRWGAWTPLTP